MMSFVAEKKDGRICIGFLFEDNDVAALVKGGEYTIPLSDVGVEGFDNYDVRFSRGHEEDFLASMQQAGVTVEKIGPDDEGDMLNKLREHKPDGTK